MTQIYVTDPTSTVRYEQNRVIVTLANGEEQSFPIESVEAISLFGTPSVSSRLIEVLLKKEIALLYYSFNGAYLGKLINPTNVHAHRQRVQARLTASEAFRTEVAKRIIAVKITKQRDLLTAYDPNKVLTEKDYHGIDHSLRGLPGARSTNEINGLEGNAAKAYFAALGKLVRPEFAFSGRSRRPPKDPFNSMLSVGYVFLFENVLGAVERHGLNPYFGVLHADKNGHAALVSDLMEEWRAMIVDDTVMQLVDSGAVHSKMFIVGDEERAVTVTREGIRVLARALREKIYQASTYLEGDEYNYGFQYALDQQVNRLCRAFEAGDPSLYTPAR